MTGSHNTAKLVIKNIYHKTYIRLHGLARGTIQDSGTGLTVTFRDIPYPVLSELFRDHILHVFLYYKLHTVYVFPVIKIFTVSDQKLDTEKPVPNCWN